MDQSLFRLLAIAVGILVCLGGLGTALGLEKQSASYLKKVQEASTYRQIVKPTFGNTTEEKMGYEIVAELAHLLRASDVQIENQKLYFSAQTEMQILYYVESTPIVVWQDLSSIASDERYRIRYELVDERIVKIFYERVGT